MYNTLSKIHFLSMKEYTRKKKAGMFHAMWDITVLEFCFKSAQ